MRILIVEDHPVVRDLLCKGFAQEADVTTVTPAANGEDAIKLLEDGLDVNIILTDYQMSSMDGLELTRRVLTFLPFMRIVIHTFSPMNLARPKALVAGAKDCLAKGGNFEELLSGIRAVHLA